MIRGPAGGLPQGPVVALSGQTMGTTWSARLAASRTVDGPTVRRRIEARLTELVDALSHWQATSSLCRFNRAPAGQWAVVPADLAGVVAAGLDMAAISAGAFDPTIGHLVDLWGFGPPGPCPPPDDAVIAAARAAGGYRHLQLDRTASRLFQPGRLALDLSGIAKGYAVDALGAVLRAAGVHDWLVEIGGELLGEGMRPDGDPWWVDLEHPPGLAPAPLRIALHGLAVATSGDYRRGAHTIDPRTGRAADNGVASVSVLHTSAMWADAWATALTVLGPDHGLALARSNDIPARILVRSGDGGLELVSPALLAMLET